MPAHCLLHRARCLALAGLCMLPLTSWSSDPASAWTDRLVVKYRSSSAQSPRAAAMTWETAASLHRAGLSANGVSRTRQAATLVHLSSWQNPRSLERAARRLMAEDPNVLWAEPDYRMQTQATASDPLFAQQWHYMGAPAGINLPAAWDLSTGSGVKVAVLDTGVRPHADLTDNLLAGYDLIGDLGIAQDTNGRDADASDPGDGCNGRNSTWHGTHVSGTVAATAENGLGGTGVAPGAQIVPVRVLGCGGGYNSDVADGIVWAAGGSVSGLPSNPHPAKVLNLSLGGPSPCSTTLQNAINTARGLGALVVVAAGNANGSANSHSPANCRGVVTVAAVGRSGARAPYSNTGTVVDLAAPGGSMSSGTANGVLSTVDAGTTTPSGDSFQFMQGTSMATPHVAGVAALMLARRSDLKPFELEVLLRSAVRPFPVACSGCGTGLLDAQKAVSAVWMGTAAGTRVNEVEPNERMTNAQVLSTGAVAVNGIMGLSKDPDNYRISVPAGGTVSVRLLAESNLRLRLVNSAGVTLAESARGANLSNRVNWTNRGTASVNVHAVVLWVAGGLGDPNGRYLLEVVR